MLVITDQVIILWQCGRDADVSLKCKHKYDKVPKNTTVQNSKLITITKWTMLPNRTQARRYATDHFK